MDAHWLWWLFAVALVIAEMFSGTFYLLAVALGLGVAGLVAYAGAVWSVQAIVAAVLCTASVAGIYRWKKQHSHPEEHVNFANDVGQTVHIASWSDERHARVTYRGAEWDAELAESAAADSAKQLWRIKELVGNRLIIE